MNNISSYHPNYISFGNKAADEPLKPPKRLFIKKPVYDPNHRFDLIELVPTEAYKEYLSKIEKPVCTPQTKGDRVQKKIKEELTNYMNYVTLAAIAAASIPAYNIYQENKSIEQICEKNDLISRQAYINNEPTIVLEKKDGSLYKYDQKTKTIQPLEKDESSIAINDNSNKWDDLNPDYNGPW